MISLLSEQEDNKVEFNFESTEPKFETAPEFKLRTEESVVVEARPSEAIPTATAEVQKNQKSKKKHQKFKLMENLHSSTKQQNKDQKIQEKKK